MNTKNDEDKILRDGESLRTSMTMMDAQQIAVADALQPKPFVADHHRPNSAILTDQQKREADERHAARDKKLSDAWKNPEPIYAGANYPQGGQGHITPERAGVTMSTDHPDIGNAPGSAANVGGAAELDAIQVANQQRYNARIEQAYKGAK